MAPHTPVPLPDLFEAQVRRTPDAVALAWGDHTVTYAGLNTAANRLAHHLIGLGAGPERIIAIGAGGADAVVAVLAVLKAGASYLPLDLAYPTVRIEYMLDDAAPMLVLTTEAERHVLPAVTPPVVTVDAPGTFENEPARDPADADRVAPLRADHRAYVIYTSGSTGAPKGVEIEHRQLWTYLDHVVRTYPGVRGRAVLHSSFAFDLTVTALYGPLISGGCVHVAALTDLGTPAAGPLGTGRPTFVKVTPSHLPLLTTLPAPASPSGELMAGGELLLGETVEAWRRTHPGARVINEYGPTETTVGCSTVVIEPNEPVPPGPLPIGQPMPGVGFHVLDDDGKPVRPGEIGELYISGPQVARGYLNRPELTAAKFLDDPHGAPGGRMYRSGDRVRPTEDGEFQFMGRVDNQAKIRGYRVELGEIEAVLTRHPDVAHAAVVVHTAAPGATRLVGYLVPASAAADETAVGKHLAESLPDYMVPDVLVPLTELPLTVNGKVDTAALLALPVTAPPQRDGAGPADELQALLCELFTRFTGAAVIGVDDDFFARGGNSVTAAQLVGAARGHGLTLSLRDVLENRTVARLAEACADRRDDET